MTGPEWLTIDGAASHLGISRLRVAAMANSDRIRSRLVRIPDNGEQVRLVNVKDIEKHERTHN